MNIPYFSNGYAAGIFSALLAMGSLEAQDSKSAAERPASLNQMVEYAEKQIDQKVLKEIAENGAVMNPMLAMQLRNDWGLGKADNPLLPFFERIGVHSGHLKQMIVLEALRAKILKQDYDLLDAAKRIHSQFSIGANPPISAWESMPKGHYITKVIMAADTDGVISAVYIAINPDEKSIMAYRYGAGWYKPSPDLWHRIIDGEGIDLPEATPDKKEQIMEGKIKQPLFH